MLWDDASYRQWTAVFSEGSYATGTWEEGGKILFLGCHGNGMLARIETLKPYETMTFVHLGEIKDGVEDTTSAKVLEWAGSKEMYTLAATQDGTQLTVTLDMTKEFVAMFDNVWPKALDIVKVLAEQ